MALEGLNPGVDEIGIALDTNDPVKDTSKDTKNRWVELPNQNRAIRPALKNEDDNEHTTQLELQKYSDLLGATDQEGDIIIYNYQASNYDDEDNFYVEKYFDDQQQGKNDSNFLYKDAEEAGSVSKVVNNVTPSVVDSVSENVTPSVTNDNAGRKTYTTKPGGDKTYKLADFEKESRGYSGYSKSNNALAAERQGKFPLSIASKKVAENLGITQGQAKWLLEQIGPCEWHHTSSHYNETDYFDTNVDAIVDAVSEFVEDVSSAEDVVEYVTNYYEKPTSTEKGYNANFDYIEWGGTRKHPVANEKHLENVYVVEKGSFYYVYDKEGGEFIIKKKIGSNGTRAENLDEKAETKKQLEEGKKQRNELYMFNTSKETRDFIDAGGSWSNSGNFYPNGKKPTPEDYDKGLDKFFENGDKRVVSTEFPGGFIMQEWDGEKFVDQEDTSHMVSSYEELPDDAKNLNKESVIHYIIKKSDTYGDGVRRDEIPESQLNRFRTKDVVEEVDSKEKEELNKRIKEKNKVITNIPKNLNYSYIEDNLAGGDIFYSDLSLPQLADISDI